MRIVMFYHSLESDWNHGNAHFLRGIVTELLHRGHQVDVYEPADGWSRRNLIGHYGMEPIHEFKRQFPHLKSNFYHLDRLNLSDALDGADLVLVHEWNDHRLVKRIGQRRANGMDFRLLFHDTHHRSVTEAKSMAAYDLRHYDGVLAFGDIIRDLYLSNAWIQRAWTWHEAADTRIFKPRQAPLDGDLVWIGNWGDGERTTALHKFLFNPVHELELNSRIHGVRYPPEALDALRDAGIDYAGWIPNYWVPEVFARFRATVHVPRRPYREMLFGIPTIRVFEALACGIPLISAQWHDGGLFEPNWEYIPVQDSEEMKTALRDLLNDPDMAQEITEHGRQNILENHTCAHRVDELMDICAELDMEVEPTPVAVDSLVAAGKVLDQE